MKTILAALFSVMIGLTFAGSTFSYDERKTTDTNTETKTEKKDGKTTETKTETKTEIKDGKKITTIKTTTTTEEIKEEKN